ncbi:GyrI-like domain-containing protein [Bizionia echini]|uniref:GyrI-like domain-containing protein n=1 Tax=Bizionia echini TaxID=649333 RepID=UPI0030DAD1C3
MKTIKYILFLLLIIIIGVSIYIAVQPNEYSVTRTRTITAPSQVIYKHAIDFNTWNTWFPWVEKNSETKMVATDSSSNMGQTYSWKTNDKKGSIKTVESIPYQSIEQTLILNDMAPSNVIWEFKQNSAKETEVSWTLAADNLSFYEKGLAILNGSYEKILGPDLERGLHELERVVLAAMDVYSIKIDGIAQHGGGFYIYTTTSSKISDLQTTINKVMPRVKSYAIKNNIAMAGAPYINYHKWDEVNNAVMFSFCIPTTTEVTTTQSDILTGQFEPFKAVKTTLKGNYTNLKEAWDKTNAYLKQYNLEASENGPMLEVYLTEPSQKPNPANWITEIYIAIN